MKPTISWNIRKYFLFRKRKKTFIDVIFLRDAEENIQMMRNSHRKEAAKDLFNDLKNTSVMTKNKIGNLYLIKNENYIISTLGAITTYVGFSKDGTLVAIQCARKNPKNIAYFANYLNHLKNTKLDSKNIIKYVSSEEGGNHIYIAVKLWDYYLNEYIENFYRPEIDHQKDNAQQKNNDQLKHNSKKIVEEMLLGLQVLHHAGVIHGEINPRNIVIDSEENVRLTDFGRNIKLDEGETTANTNRAGTQEMLTEENDFTKSSDIKAAGMLVYYILSGGKHPFGVIKYCDMQNDVQDIEAQDLINWMINNNPTIDMVLKHPYFWNRKRKEEVLRKLGDQPEVQYYTGILKACRIKKAEEGLTAIEAIEKAFNNKKDKTSKTAVLQMLGETEEVQNQNFEVLCKLCDCAENYTQDKTFNKWQSVLLKKLPNIDKTHPEDLLGLLRTLRNKLAHWRAFDDQIFNLFPDFYISLHRLATDMGWDCTWS